VLPALRHGTETTRWRYYQGTATWLQRKGGERCCDDMRNCCQPWPTMLPSPSEVLRTSRGGVVGGRLLPTMASGATSARRRCCQWQEGLLPTVARCAASARRRICQRPVEVLPVPSGSVAGDWLAMLSTASGATTSVRWSCY
jgi:hypothetical protein